MPQLTYSLPDGNTVAIDEGQPYAEAVRAIGEGLLRNALAVKIDGVNHTLAKIAEPNILDLLSHYGVRVNADMVLDAKSRVRRKVRLEKDGAEVAIDDPSLPIDGETAIRIAIKREAQIGSQLAYAGCKTLEV